MGKLLVAKQSGKHSAGIILVDEVRVTSTLRRLRARASSGLASVIDEIVKDHARRAIKKTAGSSRRPAVRVED